MQTYLDATQAYIDYCASKGYATKVFYTTGPVDGYDGENGYQRQLKHDFIRDWVRADASRILFDYADILAWNDSREE
jgi:aryl-alcohol dehydrogenase-like predicted oxidoreductase